MNYAIAVFGFIRMSSTYLELEQVHKLTSSDHISNHMDR